MTKDSKSTECRVHFEPGNLDVAVEQGSILLEAAIQAGVGLVAACGGVGTCGTCKVRIEKGIVETARTTSLSDEEFNRGLRQACQSKVMTDLRVHIPIESRLETVTFNEKKNRTTGGISGDATPTWKFSPPLAKYFVKLSQPSLSDNVSDLTRLLRSLKQEHKLSDITVDFDAVKNLPAVVRSGGWQVTITTLITGTEAKTGAARRQPKIVNIEPGDTRDKHYSLAIDVGTTTIKGQLLDLNRGQVVSEEVEYNGQMAYGSDIITRIAYCQKPGGLATLQQAVVKSINNIIARMTNITGIDRSFIGHLSVAGNTTMVQILLDIDPQHIRLSPYTPAATYLPSLKAADLGLEVSNHVYLSTFPLVASYIGGDIIAGVVAAGMHRTKRLTLYIDIGTNGEIVIGNSEWMVAAACSAGPAFEGGEIKHGMIASDGAIEECEIDLANYEPEIRTINGGKPRGICGSGLINIVAALLRAGIIGQNGHFLAELKSDRVRHSSDGYEYVLARGTDTETGSDIVITEIDIDNLMRAKAAMYAGFRTLMKSVGFVPKDIRQVIIAGAFGNYINIDKAVFIGLLPDLPRNRFRFIGNGSLTGARLADFSIDIINAVRRVTGLMTNFELSENNDFMENYLAALFLPHTNIEEFPAVVKQLAGTVARASGDKNDQTYRMSR
jgi:uncharacterized 2Fe-2S/4Fe-4S cluster protein (DUF4445 family)